MTELGFGDFLLGLLLLGTVLAAAAATASVIVRRRLAHLLGPVRATAFGLLMAACTLAAHVIPLALGVLSRGTVIVAALLLLLLASRLARRPAEGATEQPEASRESRLSWAAAIAALGAVGLHVITFVEDRLTVPVSHVDALAFHLPMSARWIQTGSLWQIENFVPGWAFGNYPNNGDVFQLVAILPWHSDLLVRYVSYPFAVLAALAVYAAAVELGARRTSAIVFAVLAVALPTALPETLDFALTDAVMYATFAAGALFALRHASTGARSDLLLAGVGFGIALGTKWYGLSTGVAVVAAWAVARLIARHRARTVLRDVGVVAAVMAVAGGIWLVRNLLLSGNPVFPLEVQAAGVTIFPAPPDPIREAAGFALLDYATDFSLWERLILPQLARSFGLAGLLLLSAALAAVVVALRRRDGRVAALAIAALLAAAVYAATPYSAFGPEGQPILLATAARYGMPAVLLAAMAAAWLARALGRFGVALDVLAAALVVEAIVRYDDFAGGHAVPLDGRALLTGALGLVALVGAALAARRIPWRTVSARPAMLATLAVAVVAVTVAVGQRYQRVFHENRYVGVDAGYDWLLRNAAAGRRAGLAGTWPDDVYPPPWIAFGPRLENEVEYVGPWIEERLERYRTEAAYHAALRDGAYDVLVVGLSDPQAPEVAWTQAAGYVEVARSHRVAVFRRG